MSDWNTAVIEEFRANDGRVAQFGDAPLVILHSIGAKSGERRDIPLVMLVRRGPEVRLRLGRRFPPGIPTGTTTPWRRRRSTSNSATKRSGPGSLPSTNPSGPRASISRRRSCRSSVTTSRARRPDVIPVFEILPV